VSEVTGPPSSTPASSAPAPQRRSSSGLGSALARGLAVGAGALVQLTSKIFGEAQRRGGAAVADFRARPEHSRWRAYALGSYGALVAGTLMAQLYTTNPLGAYVKVQPVDLPNSTMLFVRNDSRQEWKHVKLTLNGIYGFETNELKPGGHILLPVNRFALTDSATGRNTYPPKNVVPKHISVDCDSGHVEVELTP
jgi:hypothetical protein